MVGIDLLFAEEDFRSAQPERVGAPVQNIAQYDVHHLRDEQRRHGDGFRPHHLQIGGFEGSVLHQKVAEGQQDPIVISGVRVFQTGDPLWWYGDPRMLQKIFEQCDFGVA